jgi:hypothetical protein
MGKNKTNASKVLGTFRQNFLKRKKSMMAGGFNTFSNPNPQPLPYITIEQKPPMSAEEREAAARAVEQKGMDYEVLGGNNNQMRAEEYYRQADKIRQGIQE